MNRKVDFQKLVDGAEQLNRDIDKGFTIQRNVEQINESAQRLASKSVATSTDYTRNKAYSLLAQRGVDPDKLSRNLQAIDLTFDPSVAEPLGDTDLETYLQYEHESTIVTAIEEAKKETITQYRIAHDDMLNADWERARRELLESMGQNLANIVPGKQYTRPANSTSFIQSAPHIPKVVTKMDEQMMQYAQAVGRINESRGLGSAGRLAVMTQFGDVVQRIGERLPDPRSGELRDAWTLLRQMVEEHKHTHPEASFKSRNKQVPDLNTQKVFLAGTLEFLQNQYLRIMELKISQNPETARRGGEPSLQQAIRAYLKVLFYERPDKNLELMPNGDPVWPILYFCLRCGSLKDALSTAHSIGNSLGSFVTYLDAYAHSAERILPPNMWAQCCAEFNSSIRRSRDPYKILVWNIIGRCEVHDFAPFRSVIVSTQDFLWYKLMLTRTSNEPLPEQLRSQDLPLHVIQNQVLELGAAYFNPQGKTPLLYLFVLLSVQLFEHAIEFLYTSTDNVHYQVDAVHMAVGLYYYDALRLPAIPIPKATLPPPNFTEVVPVELLISQGAALPQLNFQKLIYDYSTRLSAPAEALQYFCLFREEWLRDIAIKDLVVISQEYDLLLGYPTPDGSIKPGLVHKLLPRQAKEITALVAETAEESGKYEDAIRLYELCGDLESVVKLVSSRLSSVVTARIPERERIFHTATQLYHRVKASPSASVPPTLFAEFDQLLSIGKFFTLFHEGKFEEAVVYINNTRIMPFEQQDVPLCVENFKRWSQTLTRLLPDLLIASMTSLTSLFDATKMSQYGVPGLGVGGANDGGREARMLKLRSMAHSLVTFSGMVPHRMPGDVNARLLSMEVLMK